MILKVSCFYTYISLGVQKMVDWMMGWIGNKQERYWAEALNDDKDLRSYILYNIYTLCIYIHTVLYIHLYIYSVYIYTQFWRDRMYNKWS